MLHRRGFLIFIFIWFYCFARSQSEFPAPQHPMHVIFDTDFGPDYDDVGAITLLHGFADSGFIKILATVASSKHRNAAAAIDVFNTYFNRPYIPVGVVRGNAVALGDKQHWTDSVIGRYPHKIRSNEDAEDALELYRRILASQPDHSVTIITVGFLTNLSNLLGSIPDKYSNLNGTELIRKKVVALVSMAGRFPSGKEFNLDQDAGSSEKVLKSWPGPVLFSGFEIGQKIKTGLPLIHNDKIQHSPVKDVFAICIPLAAEDSVGRMSWDETAVLIAVKGYKPWYNVVKGKMIVADDGSNTWSNEPQTHSYITEAQSFEVVQKLINELIMHLPKK